METARQNKGVTICNLSHRKNMRVFTVDAANVHVMEDHQR
jgi:hypothetical protein